MGMTKNEIIARWQEFYNSDYRKNMVDSYRYFFGHNDIEKRKNKVFFPDSTNELQEAESHLANNKLSHNFLAKLVNQKVSYGLAKPFSLDFIFKNDKKRFKNLNEILCKKYFTRLFYSRLKTICADSRLAGRGILFKYYDDNQLKFIRMSPLECCLVWEDDFTKEKLNAVIRGYKKKEYINSKLINVSYITAYELDGIREFRNETEDQRRWSSSGEQKSYGYKIKNGVKQDIDFLTLPFFIFKNGEFMQQDLTSIKSLIDDYDLICSENSNDICNISSSTKVVKGYSGDSKEEFIANMAFYNTVFLDEDGDMTKLTTPLAIDQSEIHLARLRKDIFEFGSGVDTVNRELRDVSGIALRELYADLDSEFNNWACFISEGLSDVINAMIEDIKMKTGEDYSDIDYNIIYDVDMVINEKEIAEIANLYKGILSPETLAANATWTKDAMTEVEGMKKQLKFEQKLDVKNNTGENDFNNAEKAGAE